MVAATTAVATNGGATTMVSSVEEGDPLQV